MINCAFNAKRFKGKANNCHDHEVLVIFHMSCCLLWQGWKLDKVGSDNKMPSHPPLLASEMYVANIIFQGQMDHHVIMSLMLKCRPGFCYDLKEQFHSIGAKVKLRQLLLLVVGRWCNSSGHTDPHLSHTLICAEL